MGYEIFSHLSVRPGKELQHSRQQTCLPEKLNQLQPSTGESPDGLKITAFPVTMAAETMPIGIASGKFHGDMITPTPFGS
jgi:hypothetical protein